ncbi:MAG TPA: hypothetical protein VGL46_26365 [Pseudonocardiaceae bacterium]|jgi:hypothetical protein
MAEHSDSEYLEAFPGVLTFTAMNTFKGSRFQVLPGVLSPISD